MTLFSAAVSMRRRSAHRFLGCESEIVVRVYVFRPVLRGNRARHATMTPTDPVEAGAPPNFQRTGHENGSRSDRISMMSPADLQRIVDAAFAEDLPDITSEAIFDRADHGSARFLIKAEGVLAGLAVIETVFRTLDPSAEVTLS